MAAAGGGGVHPMGQHLPTVDGYISSVITRLEVAAGVYAADRTIENCEAFLGALEDLLCMVDALEPFLQHEQRTSLLEMATSAYNALSKEKDLLESTTANWAQFVTLEHSGGRGAPTICISPDVLRELVQLGYSQVYMAELFGVNRDTIWRRLRDEGIDPHDRMAFDHIVSLVRVCKERDPYYGAIAVQGQLRSMGVRVPRSQIRDALRAVDPLGTLARRSYAVVRRAYNVAGPNHLWHQDGNHKFIKWHFVIHGMIDGYTRRVIYLVIADNNRAETPKAQFDLAIRPSPEGFGCPRRVRGDFGTENNEIAATMVQLRGTGGYIRGRSVHNQRIERLWRDVFSMCTRLFWEVFTVMESEGWLDANNETHLFCLHVVFRPRMQAALNRFRVMWDNHSLSTEHNKTPLQLWVEGRHPNAPDVPDVVDENEYGVFAEVPSGNKDDTVILDPPRWEILTEPQLEIMYDALRCEYGSTFPLGECNDHGVSMYLRTLRCVRAIVEGSM